jgi:SAM-dependent methyltransferase
MDTKLAWWNKKLEKYATEDWVGKPTIFAQWVIDYLPQKGKLLEVGAGHGQDSKYFATLGYEVTATDFADTAISYMKQKLDGFGDSLKIEQVDLSNPLHYGDNTFDVVYAHLSTHFFDDNKTGKLFSEFFRILKPGGILAILTNSVDDPEYGTGMKMGNDYFELSPGDVKHFFSVQTLEEKLKMFEVVVLDNEGTSHKDSAKGVFNLIRFVGRKPIER